jgi:DNA-binding beta-propeller fold protein YncE
MWRLSRMCCLMVLLFVTQQLPAEDKTEKAAEATAKQDEEMQKKLEAAFTNEIEQQQQEEVEAQKLLKKEQENAPYQQTAAITMPQGQGHVLGFCVQPSGSLVAISGKSDTYGDGDVVKAVLSTFLPSKKKPVPNQIVWFDNADKPVKSAELSFKPLGINAAPDGSLFVVGEGKIAVFNKQGEKIKEIDPPHMTEAIKNREKFEESVMERHTAEVETAKEQIDQFREAIKEVEAKAEADRSESEQEQLLEAQALIGYLEPNYQAIKNKQRETLIEEALERLKQVHRVAVSQRDVFLVTKNTSGHGYCVWRLDRDLSAPTKIVSQLSGCCGQMDIQVCKEGLAIAENTKHRVLIVDREGKNVLTFGEKNRTDIQKGFGGCCNPMNTCLSADGSLLTSESNGLVKSFKHNGEFDSIVGIAKVTSGCKNSSIAISPQNERLYYYNADNGSILVLTKKTKNSSDS